MAFSSTQMQCLLEGSFGNGPAIWRLNSTFMSTDLGNVTGALPGVGARPSTSTDALGNGGGTAALGVRVDDFVYNVPNASAASPNRATLHIVTGSSANWSGTAGLSTGGFDITLSAASTA